MKRFPFLLPGAITAVLVINPGLRSQEPVPAPPPTKHHVAGQPVPSEPAAGGPKTQGTAHAANEKLVRELVAILKKTKSQDTFLVTVQTLGVMGPRARAAVPAIILNAERLGLLKDVMEADDDQDSPADFVIEAIDHIVAPLGDRQAIHPTAPVGYPEMVPPPRMVSPLMCPALPPIATTGVQPQKTARQ